MKKTIITMILILKTVFFTSVIKVNAAEFDTLSNSERNQIAEGLNIASTNNTLGMGTGYKIFDVNSSHFNNAILVSERSDQDSDSVTGSSMTEISKEYGSKFGLSGEAGLALPVYNVGFSVSSNFNLDTSGISGTIQDEYYEYYEVKKKMKIAQINWNALDLETVLTTDFKNELAKVDSLLSAKALLEKYGTHVYDNYYFGGVLSISRYVASEKNIQSEYESRNMSLSLKGHISAAISAMANQTDYNMASKEVNTSNTQTTSKISMSGGNNLNALTPTDLFTYKQEYMSEYETGFIYQAWLNSVGRGDMLRVVDAERPTAIWDLLNRNNLLSNEVLVYLKQAFDILTYEQYAQNSLLLNEMPNYIESINYSYNNHMNNLSVTSNNLILPPGVTADFNFGTLLLDKYEETDIDFSIISGSIHGKMNGQTLTINSNTKGQKIVIQLLIKDVPILRFNISIDEGSFLRGFGTKEQPYLISDNSEWTQFIQNDDYFDKHFELINDIDLKGRDYLSGGGEGKKEFTGSLNGNGYTISNATIKSAENWNYIGVFGINKGSISNIKLDNIIVLNDGVNTASNFGSINAGILVGQNLGVIDKVSIKNSAIRIAGQLDANSSINVGGVVGNNLNQVNLTSIKNSHITGLSYLGLGNVNIGGIAGYLSSGTISNSYVSNNKINATTFTQADKTSASYNLGGLVGFATNSNISFVAIYKNEFNQNDKSFGNLSGYTQENTKFINAFYESISSNAVNGKTVSGTRNYRTLTLTNISNSEWNRDWREDENGNPVLRWED